MEKKKRGVLVAVNIMGVVLFSQGLSFARFGAYRTAEQTTNFHAYLLALAGVTIVLLSSVSLQLSAEIEQLKKSLTMLHSQKQK